MAGAYYSLAAMLRKGASTSSRAGRAWYHGTALADFEIRLESVAGVGRGPSTSKIGMARRRIGFCPGNPATILALERIKSYVDYGAFQPVRIASIVALRECEAEPRKICAVYQKRRDVAIDKLKKAGWEVAPPRGSIFAWGRVRSRSGSRGRWSLRSCCWRRRRFSRKRRRLTRTWTSCRGGGHAAVALRPWPWARGRGCPAAGSYCPANPPRKPAAGSRSWKRRSMSSGVQGKGRSQH